MITSRNQIILFLLSILLIACMISCGKRQTLVFDQPSISQEIGYYEKAWVDPQIRYTDSLITIIKASRVDSFYVEKIAPKFKDNLTSLAFEIKESRCFTSVLLLNNFGDLLSVLVADELSHCHYKVTINRTQISYMQPPAERFFLKVDFCGFSVVEEIR